MKVSPASARIAAPSLRPSAAASALASAPSAMRFLAPPALARRRASALRRESESVPPSMPRQRADGRAAGAVQRFQEAALRRDGDFALRARTVCASSVARLGVIGAAGDGQRALARRGRHRLRRRSARWHGRSRPSRVRPASARKVASIAPSSNLLQPRLDAAAQGDDFQVGAQMQGLGLAAQAGGADHGALRQATSGRAPWAR